MRTFVWRGLLCYLPALLLILLGLLLGGGRAASAFGPDAAIRLHDEGNVATSWFVADSPTPTPQSAAARPFTGTSLPLGIRVLSVGQKIGASTDPYPFQWSDFSADSDGAWSVTPPPSCFRVKTSTPAGTPVSTLAALVAPQASLLSIWRFDDPTKMLQVGYFSDPSQPVDVYYTNGGEEFYAFCVSSAARIGSPPATAVLSTPPLNTAGGTIIGNLKATISLSPPTITSGNSVTVTGSAFPPNDGPVTLGYGWSAANPNGGSSSGGGGGSPVTTVSGQGSFSATLTIPSDVPPTSVTVSAQSKSAKASATLQVVAPSTKGTLTLVYTPQGSGPVTDFAPDTDGYVLSGTNFAPGQVTIFLDSPQGAQLATATVAANGTFSQAFDPTAAQIGGKYGQHTLVAVQNGAVQGQLSVTVDQPIHVG
jgi:hypothetical protein